MPGSDTPVTGGGGRAIGVSLNDFPVFDGVGCPEGFIRQCRRVAALGSFDEAQLSAIMAARCRGLALQVIENGGDQPDVADLLTSAFSALRRPEAAAMQLSTIRKHSLSVTEYALQIKTLVREACPELFDQSGSVKKICAPAHQAALYRHFRIGLTSEERLLLSRQGAASFDAAVDELTREEAVAQQSAADSGAARRSLEVRWADSAAADGGRRVRSASREVAGAPPRAECEERRGRPQPRSPRPASPRSAWRGHRNSQSSDRSEDGSTDRHSARPWRADVGSRRSNSPRTGRHGRHGRHWRSTRRGSSDSEDEARLPASSGSRLRRGCAAPEQERPQVRCWLCRGYGHLKRQCPNGQ